MIPTRAQWDAAQAKWRELDKRLDTHRNALSFKYGEAKWASRTEKAQSEKLYAQMSKISDKIFGWLDQMTDRRWTSGVPSHWVAGELSYDDARKPASVPLSVVPPLAYGATSPLR